MIPNMQITLPKVEVSSHYGDMAGVHKNVNGRIISLDKKPGQFKVLVTFPTLGCSSWYDLSDLNLNNESVRTIVLLYGEI